MTRGGGKQKRTVTDKTLKSAGGSPGTGETRKTVRAPTDKMLVRRAIQKIGEKLDTGELKPTVGDLIRLVQLKKELKELKDEKPPKEIKVSWVEPGQDADDER
jgi:hypothetical protein